MNNQYNQFIEQLDRLLKARADAYPVRDESYDRLIKATEDFAAYLLKKLDANLYPDMKIIRDAGELSQNPVFICGSMKSGTTLLTHLLDGHPDLLVMPGDSHYMNNIDRWTKENFREITAYWTQRIINPSGKAPFWFLGRDESSFRNFFDYLYYFLNSEKNYGIFLSVVLSFYAVRTLSGANAQCKYWVEKTPHNEMHAHTLKQIFPKAKFIHILRDPLTNIASLKRLAEIRNWDASAQSQAQTMAELFKTVNTNLDKIGKNDYLVLKYEKLVSEPDETIKNIADFLEIESLDILFTPTEQGKSARSNSMFAESRVKGKILDQSSNKRYLEILSGNEISEIVNIMYKDAIAMEYPWDAPDIKKYLKKEGLVGKIRKLFSK